MAIEIERKFLVINTQYKINAVSAVFKQGYLSIDSDKTVRVRSSGEKGFLTIKGRTRNCSREEFEYEIPVHEAEEMLENLCIKPIIEKRRYFLSHEGCDWIVDEFSGLNEGLVVAEIELEDENQDFKKPEWLGNEISSDPRYFNSNLVLNPYKSW